MRQSNNERTQEIISMEEYLERRQEKKKNRIHERTTKKKSSRMERCPGNCNIIRVEGY